MAQPSGATVADNVIMMEVYGTSPYVDLDIDQSSLDLQQADSNVLIAAVPIRGDDGIQGPQGIQGPKGDQGDIGPQGDQGVSWNSSNVVSEIIDFMLQDGVRTTFQLQFEANAPTVEVYRNGLMEFNGLGYVLTSSSTVTHITLTTAPLSEDVIAVRYLKV